MAIVNPLFDETTGLAKLGSAAYMDSTSFASPMGNVATATALQTPRTINDSMFDGSQDIIITAQRAVTLAFPGLEAVIGDVQTDGFVPTETPEFIGAL